MSQAEKAHTRSRQPTIVSVREIKDLLPAIKNGSKAALCELEPTMATTNFRDAFYGDIYTYTTRVFDEVRGAQAQYAYVAMQRKIKELKAKIKDKRAREVWEKTMLEATAIIHSALSTLTSYRVMSAIPFNENSATDRTIDFHKDAETANYPEGKETLRLIVNFMGQTTIYASDGRDTREYSTRAPSVSLHKNGTQGALHKSPLIGDNVAVKNRNQINSAPRAAVVFWLAEHNSVI